MAIETVKPAIIVVMGISGSGKSTLARAVADRYGWPFVEGDELHPDANIAKMKAGLALTDEDRRPWLCAVGKQIANWRNLRSPGAITCSALKRNYRDQLRNIADRLYFVYLKIDKDEAIRRVVSRHGHFMSIDLVDSQLENLEIPSREIDVVTLDVRSTLDDNIYRLDSYLRKTINKL